MNSETDSLERMNDPESRDEGNREDRPFRPAIWWPLAILIGSTVSILLFDLDLRFQRLFWAAERGWRLADEPFVLFLNDFGVWPSWALCIGALFYCLACLPFRGLRSQFRAAIFLLLVAGIGPWLIVNGIFKANLGRPRPWEVTEFGGARAFVPLLQVGEWGDGASFPSGHAAMAFYLMSPYFILITRRRRLAWFILVLGVLTGCLVGASRIFAGAHFLSDILWSWGFVYLTGYALFHALKPGSVPSRP